MAQWHLVCNVNKQKKNRISMLCQAEPVFSQLSHNLPPPEVLLISMKTKIAKEHSKTGIWRCVHPIKHRPDYIGLVCVLPLISLSCSSNLFLSSGYYVLHLQWCSFWNPPIPSPPPLFNFKQNSYYVQHLIQILAPCLGWVIALWMSFYF